MLKTCLQPEQDLCSILLRSSQRFKVVLRTFFIGYCGVFSQRFLMVLKTFFIVELVLFFQPMVSTSILAVKVQLAKQNDKKHFRYIILTETQKTFIFDLRNRTVLLKPGLRTKMKKHVLCGHL